MVVNTDERVNVRNFRRISNEHSMAKHKRFMEQLQDIAKHAVAFGKDETMAKFGITCDSTYEKLIERARAKGYLGETAIVPSITQRSLYKDDDSYYDGLVRAILRHILEMESKLEMVWAAYIYEKEENRQLKEERKNWRLVVKGHEEEVMMEILSRVNHR